MLTRLGSIMCPKNKGDVSLPLPDLRTKATSLAFDIEPSHFSFGVNPMPILYPSITLSELSSLDPIHRPDAYLYMALPFSTEYIAYV